MREIIIEANQAGQRFDKFLNKYMPNAGAGFLYKMLRKKNITLNGKKSEGKEMLQPGDIVKIFFQEETMQKFMASDAIISKEAKEYKDAFDSLKGISVLFENDDILVVNKPQGILSQKAVPTDMSLNEWFIGYLLSKNSISMESLKQFKPSIANRLDRNTSGIVLCGKSLAGSQALGAMIKQRDIKKIYHAVVLGALQEPIYLDGYLKKDEKSNKVTISKNVADGDAIRTDVKPLIVTKEYSLLEIHLITGKTHQIRAHLSSIGHPILGDNKYGNSSINKAVRGAKYQLLHAREIVFPEEMNNFKDLQGKKIIAPYPTAFDTIRKELNLWQPGTPEDLEAQP